jgi:hypothetical protein
MVASWDVAHDVSPLDLRDLMSKERDEPIALLSSLVPEDWHVAAVGSWDIHAVTLHLFRSDCGRVGSGWGSGGGLDLDYEALTGIIERENDEWVEAARHIPPVMMGNLLSLSGRWVDRSFTDVDLEAQGVPVAWTGTGPSPVWLDIAREYTDRWMHHQQIRDAVGRNGLKDKEWMSPVLQTFMLAMPRAYEAVAAPRGTATRIVLTGPSGGEWQVERDADRWRLTTEMRPADAEVYLADDLAWRLYVRMVTPEDAMTEIERRGSSELTEPACRAVAVMTSVP